MHAVFLALLDGDEPVKIPAEESPMAHPIIAFIGVPYDGAATLGWPGARYAPAEVRRHLTWMLNRVQGGQIYWVDEDRIVPFDRGQLHDAGDAAVVPHDLMATLAAARAKTAEETRNGRVPPWLAVMTRSCFPPWQAFTMPSLARSRSCISTRTWT